MTAAGKDASYTYDAEGHRIGKHYEDILYFIPEGGISYTTVRFPVDTEYFYLGDTLSHVTMEGYRYINDNEIEVNIDMRFTYDAVGPLSVNYNGTEYFYLKNAQGDVTGIVNAAGTHVVAYTYDAWGKLLSTTGSMAGTLGEYNPLRYRGYVYDTETGLYYLNSRYYNPGTGRFINADSQLNDDLLGNNMFAYCGNSPISRKDIDGDAWQFILACAVVSAVASSIGKVISNLGNDRPWYEGVAGAALGGATFAVVALGTRNTGAAGFAAALVESTVNETLSYVPGAYKVGAGSKKEVTGNNIADSLVTITNETIVNGAINAITGTAAGSIVPTNSGWFQPVKLKSCLVGNYATKATGQTVIQTVALSVVDVLKCAGRGIVKSSQQGSVSVFPEPGINVAK